MVFFLHDGFTFADVVGFTPELVNGKTLFKNCEREEVQACLGCISPEFSVYFAV